jgi:hypothetical protein
VSKITLHPAQQALLDHILNGGELCFGGSRRAGKSALITNSIRSWTNTEGSAQPWQDPVIKAAYGDYVVTLNEARERNKQRSREFERELSAGFLTRRGATWARIQERRRLSDLLDEETAEAYRVFHVIWKLQGYDGEPNV